MSSFVLTGTLSLYAS